ncbi:unnamed protein product, partial [Arabidopsis halleri]
MSRKVKFYVTLKYHDYVSWLVFKGKLVTFNCVLEHSPMETDEKACSL